MPFISSIRRDHARKGQPQPQFEVTGGDVVYTAGGYKIHMFTSVGESQLNVNLLNSNNDLLHLQSQTLDVEYLVIGGGGGGGNDHGGGGGAGGYRTGGLTLPIAAYPTTVGGGGAGAPNVRGSTAARGVSGQNSVFGSITSTGGGGGGGTNSPGATTQGLPGGSGGGGAGFGSPRAAGAGTISGLATQGYPGGIGGSNAPDYQGGGGGGAGGAGNTGAPDRIILNGLTGDGNARGGDGKSSSITGATVARAGGGGGCSRYQNGPTPGGVGTFGGGSGSPTTARAQSGQTNTGGGGGGANRFAAGGRHSGPSIGPAGNGGPGIVVVRYRT